MAVGKPRTLQKKEEKYLEALKKGTHIKPAYRDAKKPAPVPPYVIYGLLTILGGGVVFELLKLVF